jgi:lipoprotein signal peptidase
LRIEATSLRNPKDWMFTVKGLILTTHHKRGAGFGLFQLIEGWLQLR